MLSQFLFASSSVAEEKMVQNTNIYLKNWKKCHVKHWKTLSLPHVTFGDTVPYSIDI